MIVFCFEKNSEEGSLRWDWRLRGAREVGCKISH
jgi:hypothetical protein